MGRRLSISMAMLVAGAGLGQPLPAAGAGADPKTNCSFTSAIALEPGLAVVPSSGVFTSGGETGTVTCDGPVRGIVPTGPGTLGVEGRYGTKDPDTCFAGEGEGRFSFTFPTAAGPGQRSNVFTFSFSLVGLSGSGFSGDGFGGGFDEVRPVEGDCLIRPVTRIIVKGHGTIERQ
jgi:hypothetical protein